VITLIYHSKRSPLLEAEKVRVSIPIIEASRFNSFSKSTLDLILLVSPGLRFVSNWKFRLRGKSRDVLHHLHPIQTFHDYREWGSCSDLS
jgi:hypothetical protein